MENNIEQCFKNPQYWFKCSYIILVCLNGSAARRRDDKSGVAQSQIGDVKKFFFRTISTMIHQNIIIAPVQQPP